MTGLRRRVERALDSVPFSSGALIVDGGDGLRLLAERSPLGGGGIVLVILDPDKLPPPVPATRSAKPSRPQGWGLPPSPAKLRLDPRRARPQTDPGTPLRSFPEPARSLEGPIPGDRGPDIEDLPDEPKAKDRPEKAEGPDAWTERRRAHTRTPWDPPS